jgi:PAS domain S-box-containing protein
MVFIALPGPSNTFVTRGWREYTGLSAEDTAGSGWQTVIHPEDLERHMEKFRVCSATGEPFEDEVRFRRAADGEFRWFLIRAVPLCDETGNILKWYGVLTDIEDRKRAEALLAGEKRVLELVAKGDPLPEILDSLCRMVEEQASGALTSVLLVEGDRLKHGGAPSLPRAYTDAIDGVLIGPCVGSCGTAAYCGKQVIVEDIATDPLWANYRDAALPHSLHACWSTPVFSSQGKVIATFAMYYRERRSPSRRDQEIIEQITHLAGVAIERKLTYDQLERNETYLAEAQRLTHTGSWAYSPATKKTLYWSEEIFRIFGLDSQNGIPHYDETRRLVHPDDRDRVSEECIKAFQERNNFTQDFKVVTADGTEKHLHVVWHPVLDKDRDLVEYVGTAADVTERRRAEQERERLRELEAELAHVNRVSMLGELAASLSHELKQPIAAAITNANTCFRWLAREEPDVGEARDAATRIVQDGNRASEIINRLRSFYTKGTPAERELVDMDEVLREMLALLRDEANRFSISMQTEAAAQVPKVTADRVQLQQVLLNLMLNGIEAMKEAGGELKIKSELGQDGHLLISVSDTGVGLPAEKADQIFDAFFTTKPHGSGMGLAISRSIVESHGGRLWATSNAGRGAVFCFTLPTAAAKAQLQDGSCTPDTRR